MQLQHHSTLPWPAVLALACVAAALAVVAFLGWVKYGSGILLAGGSALSWCF
jgi:hypothetical protein